MKLMTILPGKITQGIKVFFEEPSDKYKNELPKDNTAKNIRLDACDLFSLFTANIIKKNVPFTRQNRQARIQLHDPLKVILFTFIKISQPQIPADSSRPHFFTGLANLKSLNLYKTSIVNLTGIASLENLNNIVINSASKLISFQGLENSNHNLSTLDISNAKHLISYDSISKLKQIRKVHFYKTGSCENFDFIINLDS